MSQEERLYNRKPRRGAAEASTDAATETECLIHQAGSGNTTVMDQLFQRFLRENASIKFDGLKSHDELVEDIRIKERKAITSYWDKVEQKELKDMLTLEREWRAFRQFNEPSHYDLH